MLLRFAAAVLSGVACTPAAAQALGEASGFNLWTFGDAFLQNADAQGPVAIGGNAAINTFNVASGNPAANYSIAPPAVGLVVGGNLAIASAAVQGDAYVAGSAPGFSKTFNGTAHANVGAAGLPVNFAATNAALLNKSQMWAALAANGSVANVAGALTLTGTNPLLDVFNVSASQLPAANSAGLSITVPTGATALVNVTGTSATFSNFGTLLNNLPRNLLLYNFPDATSLAISNFTFQGSILAPNANLSFSSANIEGNVIVGSVGNVEVLGTGEYHFDPTTIPFVGVVPVPEPASLLLAAAGLAALAFRRKPRSHRCGS